MAKKVTAVNAIMKGIGRKDAKEAYAKFKFQLTKKIAEAFEWPDVAESVGEWSPVDGANEFRCYFIELTPNSDELAQHAMKIEAATIGDFQIQRKAKKEGKNSRKADKTRVDVLCTVKFTIETALATLESFKVRANKNSQMLISYDPAPVQEELDETRATDEQRQAVLEIPAGESERKARGAKAN